RVLCVIDKFAEQYTWLRSGPFMMFHPCSFQYMKRLTHNKHFALIIVFYAFFIWSRSDKDDNQNPIGENPGPIVEVPNPLENPEDGPPAGNPDGDSPIPAAAGAKDVSDPDIVIGDGTPQSCDCDAVVEAVAQGGKIVFDCGPDPITIVMDRPAKVVNDANPEVIIDGGGLITLSGNGTTRILYMNTCDQNQVWTTNHCQNQEHPQLTVQNITFANGNSIGETEYDGGGAVW